MIRNVRKSITAVAFGLFTVAALADSGAFFRAIKQDNDVAMRSLLASGVDPNTKDEKGVPGLYMALQEGSLRVARLLIDSPRLKPETRNATDEKNRLVGSAVGMAFPADKSNYGYISEHTAFGAEEQEIGDFAEDLASTMLATTLGIDFDPETAYDERRQTYLMSGKIIDSASMPCVTTGESGMWTTTISAVVFIP